MAGEALEMSSSLLQMVLDLQRRVKTLEAKLAEKKAFNAPVVQQEEKQKRAMCPHCGVKPNHFFHVKNCPEKNKNNGDTTFRRRNPGEA
jgi:hypothetical protein